MLYPTLMGRAVQYHGPKTAIRHNGKEENYAAWGARVERIAAGLVSRGIQAGDRVAIQIPNLPVFADLLFACWRIGAIAVPLNTRYSPAECAAAIRDCDPKVLFRHSALSEPECTVGWTQVVDHEPPYEADASGLGEPFYDPEAVAGLFYTSGTTGGAKGVMLSHVNLMSEIVLYQSVWSQGAADVVLHVAPLFHIAALPTLLYGVSYGSLHLFHPRFDPAAVLQAFAKDRVTGVILIPTMLNAITLHPDLPNTDVSNLKAIAYGGSPISPSTVERSRAAFPNILLMQGYGMTEVSGAITFLYDHENRGERVLACGKPALGNEAKILPTGELCVRGPLVMKGYWHRPDATAAALRDGWMHTGDAARQDEDGFLYIVDRLKDMIVTGGENVYSTEVETALSSHPAVREVAVYGIPDAQWGEAVAAAIALNADETATPDELLEHCRKLIAGYKVPKHIEILDGDLPKSGTNKILKRVLRERFWAGQQRGVGGSGA